MTNIDLKDAYLSVQIRELSQQFSVERHELSVAGPPVRAVLSTKNFYKAAETRGSLPQKEVYPYAGLPPTPQRRKQHRIRF